MNSYRLSDGTRISKASLDRKVREAKRLKLQQQLNEDGYHHCQNEECKTPNQGPFDCSHKISVAECQNTGRSDLAWHLANIKILCRSCHQKKDRLDLRF